MLVLCCSFVFFPKRFLSWVLSLFLRVLEVARSRRLGSVGEVSVWPDPVLHKISRCQFQKPVFFRSAQEFGRAFFLLEKRPLVDFPIRKVRAREFVRARRGRGFFSTQRLQICADWVLSTQRSRIRGDWILSTQRLSIHWSLRDSLGDDIAFFIPDANKISSSFSCRFFLS